MKNEIDTISTSSNDELFLEFKDLPDTSTALSSTNLNNMQKGIRQAINDKQSLPSGGTTGQVLGKNSDSDYDVGWINQTGGSTDYDAAPVGAMFDYPSLTPPIGYKICDGSELSRTEYGELFSVIGTTYGSGDGSYTFNLPNRLGRLSIGYNSDDNDFNTLGKTGGSKTHTQTVEELAKHNHSYSKRRDADAFGPYELTGQNGGGNIATEYVSNAGNSKPMDIMNPYIVSCPIIKVTGTAILKGNVVDSLEDNSTTNAPSQRAVNDAIANIVEIVDNSNGTAIKYDNGIMICYGKYDGTSGTLQGYFDQFKRTSEDMKVTFPAQFLEEPRITITPFYGSYVFSVMINSVNTNQFGFTGLKANSVPTSNTSVSINYTAIGKWK